MTVTGPTIYTINTGNQLTLGITSVINGSYNKTNAKI